MLNKIKKLWNKVIGKNECAVCGTYEKGFLVFGLCKKCFANDIQEVPKRLYVQSVKEFEAKQPDSMFELGMDCMSYDLVVPVPTRRQTTPIKIKLLPFDLVDLLGVQAMSYQENRMVEIGFGGLLYPLSLALVLLHEAQHMEDLESHTMDFSFRNYHTKVDCYRSVEASAIANEIAWANPPKWVTDFYVGYRFLEMSYLYALTQHPYASINNKVVENMFIELDLEKYMDQVLDFLDTSITSLIPKPLENTIIKFLKDTGLDEVIFEKAVNPWDGEVLND